MFWLLPPLYAALVWSLWKALSLFTNIRTVRALELPIVVQTYDPHPILLISRLLCETVWRAFPWKGRVRPESATQRTAVKQASTRCIQSNDAYFKVYPSSIELVINNPECATNVLSRRIDFLQLQEVADKLNFFGPNVQTAQRDDWRRHRKLTASAFNERVSKSVWTETTQQAKAVISSWKRETEGIDGGTRNVVVDTKKLTIQVFSFAAFGIKYAAAQRDQSLASDHRMELGKALGLILDNLIFFALVPLYIFKLTLLPTRFQDLGTAVAEFSEYMKEILDHERSKSQRENGAVSETPVHNLASALIQASESAKSGNENQPSRSLTDHEIFGNMFLYNVGGYATTSNTIVYAVALLAAYPQWQEWIGQEIDELTVEEPAAWEYPATFPRLKRCLAVMYEVLRLYPIGIAIPRRIGSIPKVIPINEKKQLTLRNTYITINVQSLHTNTEYWGSDALSWRPDRWLTSNPRANSSPSNNVEDQGREDKEVFIEPRKGTYMPWSEGPRACPGRKFSQVEFVAVTAVLFRRHRVRPKLLEGETMEEGRKRLLAMIEARDELALTTQMKDPESVVLVWNER